MLKYAFRHQSTPKIVRALSTFGSSNSGSRSHHGKQTNYRGKLLASSLIVGGSLAGWGLYKTYDDWQHLKSIDGASASAPVYSLEEVEKHKTKEERIWMTYKGKVYDITDFVEAHPGGDKIMLAAGGDLAPFWQLYAVHKSEEVYKILSEYEIGDLDEKSVSQNLDLNDPFVNDPRRHPALKIVSKKPFNAETAPSLVTDNFYTPNDLFFVRNHLPVPKVDINTFRIEVGGNGNKSVSLKLSDLKKLPHKTTISSTVMCAGNRRSDMHKYKPVKGLGWEKTAISNAKWKGVLLVDLLRSLNIRNLNCKHIQFVGLDHDITGATYGASLPAEVALDPKSQILVAYEMNDEDIPLDHGYPVRLIAPGMIGARQVKWLTKIILSDVESDSHWQQNDYKTFSPSVDWDTLDYKKSPAVNDMPVNSAICSPSPGTVIEDEDTVEVKGYAISGGGRGIIRVEVSVDDGATWHLAELEQIEQPIRQQWSWTLWKADISLPGLKDGSNNYNIICKAVDTSQSTQPESYRGTWNVRGLISNAWHKVPITVKQNSDNENSE